MAIRVTIWNEFRHEKKNPKVTEIYPNGIHEAIAASLRKSTDLKVGTATLDDPEHGLSEDVVSNTDVLVWWGHMAHAEAVDLVVERCYQRVLKTGMGLVVLHSGHFSKIFKKLMGTTCDLKWRESDDREVLWVTRPGHPIVRDVDDHFIIDKEEMYGEYFDIPEPEETIMISSFTGGEVFRSLCTWRRGAGRIVYFRPGHETYPTYHNANVLKIIENSIRWAAPTANPHPHTFGNRPDGWLDGKEKGKREQGFR
ncbi:MAG: ThuA domain-containing protein [Anaerolineae bacterium]|nr:ThuA domain-containing protein [Phycisphaerae bacterium]